MADETQRLRAALRDLVALSTIPAAWAGREPSAVANGLAEVLMSSLHLGFVFVRLSDPNGGAAVDASRGDAWSAFSDWLQHYLSAVGQRLQKQVIPDVGSELQSCRGFIIPIGVNASGGLVAVACDRPDFPTETDQLLLNVAVNHAATGIESARLIHERRRTEEELRQARAEEALRATRRELALVSRRTTIAAMSAGITHEIKQPLAAIVVNAAAGLRWLGRTPPELSELRDTLNHIAADGHRVSQVIESVRAMFNSSADQLKSALNVNELIRETIALARGEANAANIVLRLDLASELPLISGHRVQLQQVILNLVNNAIDAMRGIDDRKRELQVESKSVEPESVAVAVKDSGTGIEPENIDRIFDAFFTTKSNGMGMGLSICRSIVEAHGGRLTVAAAYPQGSVFQIVLPSRFEDSR
jgi:signal transduction histidine kinase